MSRQPEFQQALRSLVKETGIKTKDIASHLSITESAISQWLKGETLPKPEHLSRLVSLVETRGNVKSKDIIRKFYEFARKKLQPIFLGKKGPSVLSNYYNINELILGDKLRALESEIIQINAAVSRDLIVFFTDYCRVINDMHLLDSQKYSTDVLSKSLQCMNKNYIFHELTKAESPRYKLRSIEHQPNIIEKDDIKRFNKNKNKSGYTLSTLDSLYSFTDINGHNVDRLKVIHFRFSKLNETDFHIPELFYDELCFLKCSGKLKIEFNNKEIVDLTTHNFVSARFKENSIEDLRNYTTNISMNVEEDGWGIIVMYNSKGIVGESFNNRTSPYNEIEKVIGTHGKLFDEPIVLCDSISFSADAVDSFIKEHKSENVLSLKSKKPGNLRHVHEGGSSDFIGKEWMDSIFSLNALKYPFIPADRAVDLYRHYGAEIFIPLDGELRFKYAGIQSGEENMQIIPLDEINKRDIMGREFKCNMNDVDRNIIIFNSETWHGFIADSEVCYCLLIRVKIDYRSQFVKSKSLPYLMGSMNELTKI